MPPSIFFFSVMTQFFKSGKSKVMVRLSSPVCVSIFSPHFICKLFTEFKKLEQVQEISVHRHSISSKPEKKNKFFFFSLPVSYCFRFWFWFSLFSAIFNSFSEDTVSLYTHQKRTAPKKRLSYLFLKVTIYHQPKV